MSEVRFDEFEVLFRVGVEFDDPGERDREGDVVTDRSDPGDIIRAGRCFFKGLRNLMNFLKLEDNSISRKNSNGTYRVEI